MAQYVGLIETMTTSRFRSVINDAAFAHIAVYVIYILTLIETTRVPVVLTLDK